MTPCIRLDLDFSKTIFLVYDELKELLAYWLNISVLFKGPFETKVEVTECTVKSACVVGSYIRKQEQLMLNEGRKKSWKNSKMSLL
jgi:hypothetical protein